MLQFLNPLWFFAAAAIIIPVIIHLWNIKPGRVLKVGSISLMEASSRKSSRSFKLNDILLLILRCLFLLLLALMLAIPVIEQHLQTKKLKGWILIPKENFSAAYTRYKKSIDSLLQKGYEFHFFDDSLPKADIVQLLKDKALLSADTTKSGSADHWSLIKQLDTKVAADMPVYLYTTNAIRNFTGDKPAADLDLHWQTFAAADSTGQWVQEAWFTNNKSIRVVKGSSGKDGINFDYNTVPPDKGNSQFTVDLQNGRAKVGLAGVNNIAIAVDTSAIKIAIYTDHFRADAGYLKAALDAAGGFSQRQVTIKQYNDPLVIPKGQSCVFWLSEQAIPRTLLAQNDKIFAYQAGKPSAVTTALVNRNASALPTGDEQVGAFKTIGSTNASDLLWHDGYGHPLLSVKKQKQATVYSFYSRFSPEWNDLVWDSSFPRKMLQLVFDTSVNDFSKYDKRTISLSQLQPTKTTEKNIVSSKFSVKKDLAAYFWIALILVFFAERWLATSNKMVQNNG